MDNNVIPAKFGGVFNSLDSVVNRNIGVLGGSANTNAPTAANSFQNMVMDSGQSPVAANVNDTVSKNLETDNNLLKFFDDSNNPYLQLLEDSVEGLTRIEDVLSNQLKAMDDMLYITRENSERQKIKDEEKSVDESIIPPKPDQPKEEKKEETKDSSSFGGMLGRLGLGLLRGPLGAILAGLWGAKMLTDFAASRRSKSPEETKRINEEATEAYEGSNEFAGVEGITPETQQGVKPSSGETPDSPYMFPGSENAQIQSPIDGSGDFIDPNNLIRQRMNKSELEESISGIEEYLGRIGNEIGEKPLTGVVPPNAAQSTPPSEQLGTSVRPRARPGVPTIKDIIESDESETKPLKPLTPEMREALINRKTEILNMMDELQPITDQGLAEIDSKTQKKIETLRQELDDIGKKLEPYLKGTVEIKTSDISPISLDYVGREGIDKIAAGMIDKNVSSIESQSLNRYISMASYSGKLSSGMSQPVVLNNTPITNNYGGDTNVSKGGDVTVVSSGHDSLAPPQIVHNLPSSIS